MGRIVMGCVREVSLAQVSCILMHVYVAPPTPVGVWSMALGLWQRIEYYYYICRHSDINECSTTTHGCNQVCINTPGSFLCSCLDCSYRLSADGKTCNGIIIAAIK